MGISRQTRPPPPLRARQAAALDVPRGPLRHRAAAGAVTTLTLVGRNLSRSPVRTALTALSTGLSLFLLTFVLTDVDALERTAKATEGHPRIIVHHRTSFADLKDKPRSSLP